MKALAAYLFTLLATTALVSASSLSVQKLVPAPSSLENQIGYDFRYALEGEASADGSGFLVFENLKTLPSGNGNWSSTQFTTYNASANSTGESGYGVLRVTIPESSDGAVFSPIVGVMSLEETLTEISSPEALPADNVISIPEVEFRQGRMLAAAGGQELGNVGYVVTPNQRLALNAFQFEVGSDTVAINALDVRPVPAEPVLEGVAFQGEDPQFRFLFNGLTANPEGLPLAIDEGNLWWEASPLFENVFRASQNAPNLPATPGWIFEPHFPWIYFYGFESGKWIYPMVEGGSPTGFYGYHEEGYWLYFYFNNDRWFYDFTEEKWNSW